jgi:hypothetical protein
MESKINKKKRLFKIRRNRIELIFFFKKIKSYRIIVLVVVVKGVEEDTETDPLVAGAKHRTFQSLRLLKKLSFHVKTDIN